MASRSGQPRWMHWLISSSGCGRRACRRRDRRRSEAMRQTLDAVLFSWPFDPWLLVGLALTAGIYFRGWRDLHRRDSRRWSDGRLLAFFGGLFAIFLALGSPIEPFAGLLLQVHMLQHLLLMMAAPPLIWLGWPLFPLVRGLPSPVRIYWAAPFLRSPGLRHICG